MINNSFYRKFGILVILAFICSGCIGSPLHRFIEVKPEKVSPKITFSHPLFNELEKKWIYSSYFDHGMNYKGSRLKVVSFSQLLDSYPLAADFDAILLNCVDDYQGMVTIDEVYRYDLQLAIKIDFAHGSDKPSWLNPLLIVVPNNTSPPFIERYLTANISELQFVRIADYYRLLDSEVLVGASANIGRVILKNNCIFCHSINGVGGNKGGSLLKQFDFQTNSEQLRFKDTFLAIHGQYNANKQNTKQFLTDKDLVDLLIFLSEINLM